MLRGFLRERGRALSWKSDGYDVDTDGRDETERPLGRAGPISTVLSINIFC